MAKKYTRKQFATLISRETKAVYSQIAFLVAWVSDFSMFAGEFGVNESDAEKLTKNKVFTLLSECFDESKSLFELRWAFGEFITDNGVNLSDIEQYNLYGFRTVRRHLKRSEFSSRDARKKLVELLKLSNKNKLKARVQELNEKYKHTSHPEGLAEPSSPESTEKNRNPENDVVEAKKSTQNFDIGGLSDNDLTELLGAIQMGLKSDTRIKKFWKVAKQALLDRASKSGNNPQFKSNSSVNDELEARVKAISQLEATLVKDWTPLVDTMNESIRVAESKTGLPARDFPQAYRFLWGKKLVRCNVNKSTLAELQK